jgi:hypothetical protein
VDFRSPVVFRVNVSVVSTAALDLVKTFTAPLTGYTPTIQQGCHTAYTRPTWITMQHEILIGEIFFEGEPGYAYGTKQATRHGWETPPITPHTQGKITTAKSSKRGLSRRCSSPWVIYIALTLDALFTG